MYHFVRDLEHSRYPGIKGLSLNAFREQIEYIRSHYNLVKMEDVIEVIDDQKKELPPRALLLTFDDGYIDHFINVFPILDEMKVQGSFFPPAKPIVEDRVLDVNKIHFVLASLQDPSSVTAFIFSKLDEHRDQYSLEDKSHYYSKLSEPSRYDSGDVTFIKKILQRNIFPRNRKPRNPLSGAVTDAPYQSNTPGHSLRLLTRRPCGGNYI
jgi:hypothetical protein